MYSLIWLKTTESLELFLAASSKLECLYQIMIYILYFILFPIIILKGM